jgi:hypothetical protein
VDIQRTVFYRYQHVTGPGCVLVSLKFGVMPASGPRIVRLLAEDKAEPKVAFDLDAHVKEILEGVAQANSELNGQLQVEVIEVVPDDYPQRGQALYTAHKIACAVLQNAI